MGISSRCKFVFTFIGVKMCVGVGVYVCVVTIIIIDNNEWFIDYMHPEAENEHRENLQYGQ